MSPGPVCTPVSPCGWVIATSARWLVYFLKPIDWRQSAASDCPQPEPRGLSPAAAGPLVTATVFRPLIVLGPLADSDTPLGILRVASARWLAVSDTPLGTLQVVTTDNGLPILLVVTLNSEYSHQELEKYSDLPDFL